MRMWENFFQPNKRALIHLSPLRQSWIILWCRAVTRAIKFEKTYFCIFIKLSTRSLKPMKHLCISELSFLRQSSSSSVSGEKMSFLHFSLAKPNQSAASLRAVFSRNCASPAVMALSSTDLWKRWKSFVSGVRLPSSTLLSWKACPIACCFCGGKAPGNPPGN